MTEIYRAYDSKGRLLYLGITNDFRLRMHGHKSSSNWFVRAASFKRRTYGSRSRASAVEDRAIRLLKPPFNVISQSDKMERWGQNKPASVYADVVYQEQVEAMRSAFADVSEDDINEYLGRSKPHDK